MQIDGQDITRVDILVPALLSSMRLSNWKAAQKVGEVVRFASRMTEHAELRPFFFENGLAAQSQKGRATRK